MTESVKCAVCGKTVLKTAALSLAHQGQTFYACGPGCRDKFTKNPAKYAKAPKAPSGGTPQKP